MQKWFVTWNRPEYKEWALAKKYGYLLLIIRKQAKDFLVAKAKLIMGKKGFPAFKTLKTVFVASNKEAIKQINNWQKQN